MHTKRQVQQLLALSGVSPNKRLGQNFLIDLNLMRLLIDRAGIGPNDTVLEVGCGTGSLTEGLAEKAGKVVVAEYDKTLAKIAEGLLAGKRNTEIINTDILENKHTISGEVVEKIRAAKDELGGRFLLVANLPYGAGSPVMLNLVMGEPAADAMYVTVQKEVAQRMQAKVGSKHYGILSIAMAATGEVKIERILKPCVFWPEPQVDSAMVSFVRDEEKVKAIKDMSLFSQVVGLFMGHRRKMIKACVKFAAGELGKVEDWQGIFDRAGVDPTDRPERVLPEGFVLIANAVGGNLTTD